MFSGFIALYGSLTEKNEEDVRKKLERSVYACGGGVQQSFAFRFSLFYEVFGKIIYSNH